MSTDSEDEVDNDDDEQDEGGDDVEMEEDVAPAQRTLRPPRRRPGTRAHQESDAEQEKDGEGDDQDEGEQDGEELGEGASFRARAIVRRWSQSSSCVDLFALPFKPYQTNVTRSTTRRSTNFVVSVSGSSGTSTLSRPPTSPTQEQS